jgi:hypothetical protein
MSSPVAARVAVDALGMTPTSYGHLQQMAARCARLRLDGHAVVNRRTGAAIGLDYERGLKNATAPGMPPALLLAVPAIPAMLAAARYLGALPPRPPYPPHVLRYHAFAARAEVGGRRVDAVLVAQEDRQHRLFLDRVLGGEAVPRREAGGANSDASSATLGPADDAASTDWLDAAAREPSNDPLAVGPGGIGRLLPYRPHAPSNSFEYFVEKPQPFKNWELGPGDSLYPHRQPTPEELKSLVRPLSAAVPSDDANASSAGAPTAQEPSPANGGAPPIAAPPRASTATASSPADDSVPAAPSAAPDPAFETEKPIPYQGAAYEKMGARLRDLNSKYDPDSWGDRLFSAFTGGLDDPSRVLTDSERVERRALKDKLHQIIQDHFNPPLTPAEARLGQMADSPLGTAAWVAAGALGANEQQQDAALGTGAALEGMGTAALGPRPYIGPLPNPPMVEAVRPVETKPQTELRAPPPDVEGTARTAPEAPPIQPDTEESPESSAAFAGNKPQSPRPPFKGDFPEVVIHRRWAQWMGDDPDYLAAKAGDPEAAERFVNRQLDPAQVNRVRDVLRGRKPVIVTVHADESDGRNMLPQAYGKILGDRLGLTVDSDIVQANRVGRTGTDAEYRLLKRAKFDGQVEPGQQYLIIDDNTTQGGTLADLRGYIEGKGGKVIGATTLTAGQDSNILAPDPKIIDWLHRNAQSLQQWWRRTYGYDFRGFTQSEANYVQGLVQRLGPDAVRDRFIARTQAPDVAAPGRTDRSPQGGRREEGGAGQEITPDGSPDGARRAGGAVASIARVSGRDLEMAPTSYGHLQMMTARYARLRLDGHSVVNRQTGAPIMLAWSRGLENVTAPGMPPLLMLAVPAIPAMVAAARYVGAFASPSSPPDVVRYHAFAADVEVAGRRLDVALIVRENRRGKLFLDRVIGRDAAPRRSRRKWTPRSATLPSR